VRIRLEGGTHDTSVMASNEELALRRTFLAHERTLMAWVRTSVSLISFGFTIYKFFQYLSQEIPFQRKTYFGPREFAVAMIGLGVLSLAMAVIDYRHTRKILGLDEAKYRSLAGKLAGIVFVFGLALLIAVLLRL
jgi:putative membrane protein